jgi:hypothetical protein
LKHAQDKIVRNFSSLNSRLWFVLATRLNESFIRTCTSKFKVKISTLQDASLASHGRYKLNTDIPSPTSTPIPPKSCTRDCEIDACFTGSS